MSGSGAVTAQFVRERALVFDFSDLAYEVSSENYVRLEDAQGRARRSVDKVTFDYGISFQQSDKGRTATCRLSYAIADLDGPALMQNVKNQDCLDIWITVKNIKSCTVEGDAGVAALLPLAVHAISLRKFKLTLDVRESKKKISRDTVRTSVGVHLTARVSRAPESTIGTYFEVTRKLLEKEGDDQKARTPSLESCKIQTLSFGGRLGIGIWPRADLTEEQRTQEVGSNFAVRYSIHDSSVFTREALVTHKILGAEEAVWEFSVLGKIPRCNAPIVGFLNNPFHGDMGDFVLESERPIKLLPMHNDVLGTAQLRAIDTFKADLDELSKEFFTGGTAARKIRLPINALFLSDVAYDASSNILEGQTRPTLSQQSVDLNESQNAAVSDAFKYKMLFIWGPAATGKSTVMAMIAILKMQLGRKVLLTATRNVAVDALLGRSQEIGETQKKEFVFVRVYPWSATTRQYLEELPVFNDPCTLDNRRVALAQRLKYRDWVMSRKRLLETGSVGDKVATDKFRRTMAALTREVMDNADAAFCTTSMLTSGALVWKERKKIGGKMEEVRCNWPAKTIIFDEMACSNPAEYLIAVTAFNEDVEDITAGGDHLQLDSHVETEEAKQAWQKPCLFETGVKRYPSQTLNVSYR